jgi:hypothetical protein
LQITIQPHYLSILRLFGYFFNGYLDCIINHDSNGIGETGCGITVFLIHPSKFFSFDKPHPIQNQMYFPRIPDGYELLIAVMVLETGSLIWTVKPKPHLQNKGIKGLVNAESIIIKISRISTLKINTVKLFVVNGCFK